MLLSALLLGTPVALHSNPASELTVGEGFVNPIGFYDTNPTFSWKLPEGTESQIAYELEVHSETTEWNSGWVASTQTLFAPYGGPDLQSREQVTWKVRFKDPSGMVSDWSQPATFELGLIAPQDWKAHWIHPSQTIDREGEVVATLRKQFSLDQNVKKARLYVAAKGLFEAKINGSFVTEDVFANGWTSYNKQLDSVTYDVTSLLSTGDQCIQVRLGTGWYAGHLGWEHKVGIYGQQPELLLQLELTFEDGSTKMIATDESWEGSYEGPILVSSIYDGETYDARRTIDNWETVSVSEDLGETPITPKSFPPVRICDRLVTQTITNPETGRYVFDLGQNMVGWPQLKVPMKQGETLTIRFAEMLNADGTLYTENYRSAKSTDTYTAAKDGMIEWHPTFTFHGFRYVELSGFDSAAKPVNDWVTGLVLHSDLQRIGRFHTSNSMLNQLQSNIVWGQRGNFVDIPTDCPQRDERLGWTGDAQVFCPTASFNYDCLSFWKHWLKTMQLDQFPDGRIPHVIPDILGDGGCPGWVDAATIIPWETYVRTGDLEILEASYPMMEKLVAWYRSKAVDHIYPTIWGFADWLQPYSENINGDTAIEVIGTAFYAHSTWILAKSAEVLGKTEHAVKYREEFDSVRNAFTNHFFDESGKLQNAPETQTSYILALAFNLIPESIRPAAAANLVQLVHDADDHLRTGFLGTPHIVRVLDDAGYTDLALKLLFQDTYPSWFYPIHQGATTMWERWNSYSHENGFGDAGMNSFNHYAYGAIGQWMYERLAGLAPDPDYPGYQHFFINPLICEQLDHASAELMTPYGKALSSWTRDADGNVTLKVIVPPNTTATMIMRKGQPDQILQPGIHQIQLSAVPGHP